MQSISLALEQQSAVDSGLTASSRMPTTASTLTGATDGLNDRTRAVKDILDAQFLNKVRVYLYLCIYYVVAR